MSHRLCRWLCGRHTDRHCCICLDCCDARDEMNNRIDAGLEAYVPPDKRPDHRFYERTHREPTEKQLAYWNKKALQTDLNGPPTAVSKQLKGLTP